MSLVKTEPCALPPNWTSKTVPVLPSLLFHFSHFIFPGASYLFFFCSFPGFLAIFILLSSNNNNNWVGYVRPTNGMGFFIMMASFVFLARHFFYIFVIFLWLRRYIYIYFLHFFIYLCLMYVYISDGSNNHNRDLTACFLTTAMRLWVLQPQLRLFFSTTAHI